MVWDAVKHLWATILASADKTVWTIEQNAPGFLKIAVVVLIGFLLAWVIILQRKAHVFDTERRAQQVRAQAAERNGLKLAPLGDNSLPDPKYAKDGHFWRNFFLLAALVGVLSVLAHQYVIKKHAGGAYDYGPVYAGPSHPPPQAVPTVWLEPQRPIQPASQRVFETRPTESRTARAPAAPVAPVAACGGAPIQIGDTEFMIRSEAMAAPQGAGPEFHWTVFNAGVAQEARRYYETRDWPLMVETFGARSPAAAYSANNLAVALFFTGECGRAESMFRAAQEVAGSLNMPLADRIRIEQNYAHFRALRTTQGGG